jgi:glycosyltransferase involved in cell wall biosynthesis
MEDNMIENFFSITINTYNHKDWIEKCLMSCIDQNYKNFEVILIDDISNDGTHEICESIGSKFSNRVKIIQNQEKIYSQLRNISNLTKLSKDGSVVISVDGDDFLKDNDVLNKLNSVYNTGDVWMTYGRYEEFPYGSIPPYREYPKEIIESNCFREYNWLASHLKTYRKELFLKINEDDFKFENGEWFDVTGDQAFMFPMLEMSAERSRFVDDILYCYNVINPTRDGSTRVGRQEEVSNYIKAKNKYQRIDSL